jgi:serine/threonine-protein kinase
VTRLEDRISDRLRDAYALERELGGGGMSRVFVAVDRQLDRRVAIKVLRPELAAGVSADRFRREILLAASLQHPHVVPVLAAGDVDGLPYFVMPFVDGESLRGRLRDGPLSVPEAVRILRDVARALAAAHARGVVHRDIKPDNVLLSTSASGALVAKVVDFGLVHLREEMDAGRTLTRGQMVAGTPEYMSPEQCRSLSVGAASDIYALGCLLTDLLQGAPPFRGPSKVDVMAKHMFFPPPPLDRPPGAEPVPAAIEALRIEMLAKAVEQRPGSVADVRRRFEEAIAAVTEIVVPPASLEAAPSEPGPSGAPAEPTTAALPTRTIGVMRLEQREEGATDLRFLELATQGYHLLRVSPERPTLDRCVDVVVLDAGAEVLAALTWLGFFSALDPRPAVIVCVAEATLEIMNQLMRAGAATLVAYPVTDRQLTDRVAEVLERQARNTGAPAL